MVNNKYEIITFLQAHKDEMSYRFGVVSIGLFGSYARGEAREDSDIDIAIELKPEKKSDTPGTAGGLKTVNRSKTGW